MKSRLLIALSMLNFSFFATVVRADESAREFSFAPVASYSTYDGYLLGAKIGLGISISSHWQVFGEARATAGSSYSKYDFLVGAQYNFAETLRDSFYLGGGIGFVNRVSTGYKSNNEMYSVRAGYRVKISENFNWSPNVSLTAEPAQYGIGIDLLNFSVFF